MSITSSPQLVVIVWWDKVIRTYLSSKGQPQGHRVPRAQCVELDHKRSRPHILEEIPLEQQFFSEQCCGHENKLNLLWTVTLPPLFSNEIEHLLIHVLWIMMAVGDTCILRDTLLWNFLCPFPVLFLNVFHPLCYLWFNFLYVFAPAWFPDYFHLLHLCFSCPAKLCLVLD